MVKIGNSVCAFFIIFSASWCSPDVLNPLGSTFWIASRSKGSHFLAGENLTAIRATTPDDEEAVKTRWLPNPPCARYISGFSPPGGGVLGPRPGVRGGPDSDRSEGVLIPVFCLRSSSCIVTMDRRVLVWRWRAGVQCQASETDGAPWGWDQRRPIAGWAASLVHNRQK